MKVVCTFGEQVYAPSIETLMPFISICGGSAIQQDNSCYYKVEAHNGILYWESGVIGGRVFASGVITGVKVRYQLTITNEGYTTIERYDTLSDAMESPKIKCGAAILMVAELI